MIKYYKIPKWHIVYAKYDQYIQNRKRTAELAFQFMRKHNLFCGLIRAGETEKIKRKGDDYIQVINPYFMISDKDSRIIEHDKRILGVSLLKPTNDGYYPIRLNSPEMGDWKKILKDNENFKVLSIPDISEYVALLGKRKGAKGYAKTDFYKDHEDLYVRISTLHEKMEVHEDFIECPEAEGYFKEVTK